MSRTGLERIATSRLGWGSLALLALGLPVIAKAAGAAGAAAMSSPTQSCANMAELRIGAVTITSARNISAAPFNASPPERPPAMVDLPAHCQVSGVIEPRTGVDGKPYGIHFELRLPTAWNGRFLFQGGGGLNGFVAPAIGAVKGPPALTRGFAVVTQDAGHSQRDASFGADQQARLDMIYRSYERVTAVAKQIVADYYGRPADHSYYFGCSEGGREALLVSQRMPLEFDGVVAGDPGFLLGVSFQGNADRLAVAAIAPVGSDGRPDYARAFSASDLALFKTAILDDCDGADGLKDGLIDNPGCRPHLERLICVAAKTDMCLTRNQVAALRAIFDGGLPEGGGLITKGYFYNTAVDQPSWHGKLTGPGMAMGNPVDSTQGVFSTPYDPGFDDRNIDLSREDSRFREVGALNRTDGVMYSSFRQHGGKLLIYTGTADQAFSAKELLAYHAQIAMANGGEVSAAKFERLFLVSGMTHCGGGQSLDQFDPLRAMVDWVETDVAPVSMIATGKAFPGRSRPVCAYPLQPRYAGHGSIESATSFSCREPANSEAGSPAG